MSAKIWVWWASEFGKGGEVKLPTMMFSKYKHYGGERTHRFIISNRERERLKIPLTVSQQPKTEWSSKHINSVWNVFSPDKGVSRTALWWMTQGPLSSWTRDFNTVHSSLHLCVLPSLALPSLWAGLTVNHHSCWQAPPLGHDVGCHTGVIPWIWEPGLPDDQVMVSPGVDVLILFRVNGLLIFQPFHLQAEKICLQVITGTHFLPRVEGVHLWYARREMDITHRGVVTTLLCLLCIPVCLLSKFGSIWEIDT